ncbi:MAG: hypothetical protein KatS3mg100_210 [Candidatus Parcubacteria bacterium]|nr:MAG: hypothetical protein KatS3mg100_210 [Candidatus Parcubacteria bacterium]
MIILEKINDFLLIPLSTPLTKFLFVYLQTFRYFDTQHPILAYYCNLVKLMYP